MKKSTKSRSNPVFKRSLKTSYAFLETLIHEPATRTIGDILEDIDTLTKEAYATTGKPQEVEIKSRAVSDIPALMKGLGYYLADAELDAALAKDDLEYMKLKKEKEVIDGGKSVAVAERTAGTDDELIQAKERLRKAQHNYKVLKLQYDSTDRQFEGWRSRLSVIKNDIRNEGYNVWNL